jgi:uncharacterized membrane protein YfcA
MWFDVLVIIIALIAGAVAAVTGFGIGSLLTPVLTLHVDTRLAVAAVSVPHVIGTALRFWLLRGDINLGGLVGNQGGIRSAALLGFDLSKETFVATATAIALFVDGARLPVYIMMEHNEITALWPWVALASLGVTIGTVLGSRVLVRIPESWFRRALALILAVLGGAMLVRSMPS